MKERKMVPRAEPQSYYGRPILKAAVWTWEVPGYLFTGGLAGASAPLALAARGNPELARRAALLALGGITVSPVLLISDLGRPERFYRMLRVFRPTSAMSVGTWLVSAFGAVTALATPWHLGLSRRGRSAAVASATIGPLVSTYTAVLIVQTSVPVWHDARHVLPWVFAGSSLASAGGAAAALTPAAHAGPARALAIGGAALEVAADAVMTRRLDPVVRAAYRDAKVRPVHLAALAATVSGAALLARRHRGGGALLCAGALLERVAVIRAGRASAADPAATVTPQRMRMRGATPDSRGG